MKLLKRDSRSSAKDLAAMKEEYDLRRRLIVNGFNELGLPAAPRLARSTPSPASNPRE